MSDINASYYFNRSSFLIHSLIAQQDILQILGIDNKIAHNLLPKNPELLLTEDIAKLPQIPKQVLPTSIILAIQQINSNIDFPKRTLIIPQPKISLQELFPADLPIFRAGPESFVDGARFYDDAERADYFCEGFVAEGVLGCREEEEGLLYLFEFCVADL